MRDVLTYLAVLLIFGILRAVLTRLKPVKTLLIKKTVRDMEKKIRGSDRGKEKKARCIKRLRWLGVKVDEATSLMIDVAVDAMNAGSGAAKSSLQDSMESPMKKELEAAGLLTKSETEEDEDSKV